MGRLEWGRKIQALAQTGLAYCREPYDRERYQQLLTIAHEMLAEGAGATAEQVEETFKLERGYPTPKVDVRAVVFEGDRLLFVREKATGFWTLPGGWADIGDTPSSMAVRETLEESGFEVKATKLLAVFDKARHSHPPTQFYAYKLFLRCELLGGAPRANHETLGVAFFDRHHVPALDVERTTAAQVERMFLHFDQPDRPTDFD